MDSIDILDLTTIQWESDSGKPNFKVIYDPRPLVQSRLLSLIRGHAEMLQPEVMER